MTPNQESVKEIQVLSSTYSAEDGRNTGAQIKVVSQNGTNEFHGSALFKYNDPDFNAFNKFGGITGDPTMNAPPVRVNQLFRQFAGSLGGPIIKNKLFFFFSYEGLRNSTTNTSDAWVETPQFRQLVINQRPGSVTAKVFGSPGIEPRIVTVLPWSKERDNVDKLNVGSMAKYTLSLNAARDRELLALLKWARIGRPKATRSFEYCTVMARP